MNDSTESENPLRPLSLPLALLSILALILSMWVLFSSAKATFANPAKSFPVFTSGFLLLSFGIFYLVAAAKSWLRLPKRSVQPVGIGDYYSAAELEELILSQQSPNKLRHLSWLGSWLHRVSGRFSSAPIPYQRLVEVAFVTLMFLVPIAFITIFFFQFASAADRADVADALSPWLKMALYSFLYLHWAIMLKGVFSASRWGSALTVKAVVVLLLLSTVVEVGFALVSSRPEFSLPEAPDTSPFGIILIAGTVAVLTAISLVAYLRTNGMEESVHCTRIQENNSLSAHPQSIVNALRGILSQTKAGLYSEVNEWKIQMNEQRNMPGGSFDSLLVGEYGAAKSVTQNKPSLGAAAVAIAVVASLFIAASFVFLFSVASSETAARTFLKFIALSIFGHLLLMVATFPLSESIWTSWIMVFRVKGSYQSRGAVMMASNAQGASMGSFLIDYTLDGGIAKAESSAFINSVSARASAKRVLVGVYADNAEGRNVEENLRGHLSRASSSTHDARIAAS